eukprot:2657663-Alexandrium_andersonii.AAC.1
MSASLVGSEMCIRDRSPGALAASPLHPGHHDDDDTCEHVACAVERGGELGGRDRIHRHPDQAACVSSSEH